MVLIQLAVQHCHVTSKLAVWSGRQRTCDSEVFNNHSSDGRQVNLRRVASRRFPSWSQAITAQARTTSIALSAESRAAASKSLTDRTPSYARRTRQTLLTTFCCCDCLRSCYLLTVRRRHTWNDDLLTISCAADPAC